MIFIITDNHVKRNCKKFGFSTYDSAVVEGLNKALMNFVEKKIVKAAKSVKGGSKIDVHHLQSGGRVLMPSEYFGVPSDHYTEVLSSNGVDMTVNNMWIRPPMDILSPDYASAVGGGPKFEFPFTTFKSACVEAQANLNHDLTISIAAQNLLHKQFVQQMNNVFKAVSKKVRGDHLHVVALNDVLSMKKFNMFHKN
jgi:hypothetical protein